MNQSRSYLFSAVLFCATPFYAYAQAIDLQAISDFTNLNSGEVPYYLDIAGDRNALAINAADPSHRNKFARAEHEYIGADGLYDITINALGEIDGDGTYRLLINGVVQGVSVNAPVNVDYTVIKHRFQGIALIARDIIAVESNAVSNDTIPEGDGFAFARGRWRSVTIDEHDSDAMTGEADTTIDLGVSLSTVESLTKEGDQAPFIISVFNHSQLNTATAPVVEIHLPDEITFSHSDGCTQTQSGLSCVLPNIAPSNSAMVSFTGNIEAQGWLSLSASISADQIDSDRINNTDTLSFQSQPQNTASENMQAGTTGSTDMVDNGNTSSGTGNGTSAGTSTSTDTSSTSGTGTNTGNSSGSDTTIANGSTSGNETDTGANTTADTSMAATTSAVDTNSASGALTVWGLIVLLVFSTGQIVRRQTNQTLRTP